MAACNYSMRRTYVLLACASALQHAPHQCKARRHHATPDDDDNAKWSVDVDEFAERIESAKAAVVGRCVAPPWSAVVRRVLQRACTCKYRVRPHSCRLPPSVCSLSPGCLQCTALLVWSVRYTMKRMRLRNAQ